MNSHQICMANKYYVPGKPLYFLALLICSREVIQFSQYISSLIKMHNPGIVAKSYFNIFAGLKRDISIILSADEQLFKTQFWSLPQFASEEPACKEVPFWQKDLSLWKIFNLLPISKSIKATHMMPPIRIRTGNGTLSSRRLSWTWSSPMTLYLSTVEVSYANPLPEKKWLGLSEIIPWNIRWSLHCPRRWYKIVWKRLRVLRQEKYTIVWSPVC